MKTKTTGKILFLTRVVILMRVKTIQSLLLDLRQSLLVKVLLSKEPRKLCAKEKMSMRRKMNASN